jgi:[ribosomal protein S5]-alanine N-acetyltransferase
MFLETPRFWIIGTPLSVMEKRLRMDSFSEPIFLANMLIDCRFPPDWPGDALVLFPSEVALRKQKLNTPHWAGVVIDRASKVAVAQAGFKGGPDASGTVEVGYGVNASARSQGVATQIVGALRGWALARDDVQRVRAETAVDNRASMRVLEKNEFTRVGERMDADEGAFFLWERCG